MNKYLDRYKYIYIFIYIYTANEREREIERERERARERERERERYVKHTLLTYLFRLKLCRRTPDTLTYSSCMPSPAQSVDALRRKLGQRSQFLVA